MTIIRRRPMLNPFAFERDMNRMLDLLNTGVKREDDTTAVWSPVTDVYEEDNQFVIVSDLPGVNENDIKLNFEENKLRITGERHMPEQTDDIKFHRIERAFGRYSRTFELPKNVDVNNISASYKNGQLTVVIPKTEEAKPKDIKININ